MITDRGVLGFVFGVLAVLLFIACLYFSNRDTIGYYLSPRTHARVVRVAVIIVVILLVAFLYALACLPYVRV